MGQASAKPLILTFHKNHGEDIELGDDWAAVRVENRTTSFSSGSIFSAEPVKINQKIYIKLLVVARKSHDVVSVGFTTKNPSEENYREGSTWTCSLSRYFCIEDAVICFYVDASGIIHYKRGNSPEFKSLGEKVDVSKPLWAVFYLWSEPTTIKLLNQNEVRQSVFQIPDELAFPEDFHPGKATKDSGIVTDVRNEDNDICVICCNDKLEVVFVPCGHFSTCFECAQWIRNKDNLCPICRIRIGSVVKVFKS